MRPRWPPTTPVRWPSPLRRRAAVRGDARVRRAGLRSLGAHRLLRALRRSFNRAWKRTNVPEDVVTIAARISMLALLAARGGLFLEPRARRTASPSRRPPAGSSSPGIMGFMQFWRPPSNEREVLMLFKSPTPLETHDVFKQLPGQQLAVERRDRAPDGRSRSAENSRPTSSWRTARLEGRRRARRDGADERRRQQLPGDVRPARCDGPPNAERAGGAARALRETLTVCRAAEPAKTALRPSADRAGRRTASHGSEAAARPGVAGAHGDRAGHDAGRHLPDDRGRRARRRAGRHSRVRAVGTGEPLRRPVLCGVRLDGAGRGKRVHVRVRDARRSSSRGSSAGI